MRRLRAVIPLAAVLAACMIAVPAKGAALGHEIGSGLPLPSMGRTTS
jgi:hypothetical protein